MTETQQRRRMDRVRRLLQTRNDYADDTRYSSIFRESSPVVVTGDSSIERPRVMTLREYDDSIARLDRDRMTREGVLDTGEKERWEYSLDARNRSGSYLELDRILGSMTPEARVFLDLFHSGFIKKDEPAKVKEERLVRYIEERMPQQIKMPRRFRNVEDAGLAILVRALSSAGNKISEVAREVGITKRHVVKLLTKRT